MGHPAIPCPCGQTSHPQPLSISPYSAWPFARRQPRCPATTRHTSHYDVRTVGLQCHYEPGHEGDHAASPGLTEGDVFWPQAAAAKDGAP